MEPLIERNRIVFSPLHLKLDRMTQFVKAVDKEGECFQYICRFFPKLNSEKVRAGIFDGSQIRKVTRDSNFALCMTEIEVAAWNLFVVFESDLMDCKFLLRSFDIIS